MRTTCGVPALSWTGECHELGSMENSTLHECSRCGLQCPHDHVATASRARCPVHVAHLAGNPWQAATRWQRQWVALQGLWGRAAYGQEGGPGSAPVEAPPLPAPGQVEAPEPPGLPPEGSGPEAEPLDAGIPAVGMASGWNRLARYHTHMATELVGGLVCLRCGEAAGRVSLHTRWLGAPCREELRPEAMPRRVIAALRLQPTEWRSRLSPPKALRVAALVDSEVERSTGAVGSAGVLRWQHLGM
jgi:hypothetical protein